MVLSEGEERERMGEIFEGLLESSKINDRCQTTETGNSREHQKGKYKKIHTKAYYIQTIENLRQKFFKET